MEQFVDFGNGKGPRRRTAETPSMTRSAQMLVDKLNLAGRLAPQ